jgi:hypothetical protein
MLLSEDIEKILSEKNTHFSHKSESIRLYIISLILKITRFTSTNSVDVGVGDMQTQIFKYTCLLLLSTTTQSVRPYYSSIESCQYSSSPVSFFSTSTLTIFLQNDRASFSLFLATFLGIWDARCCMKASSLVVSSVNLDKSPTEQLDEEWLLSRRLPRLKEEVSSFRPVKEEGLMSRPVFFPDDAATTTDCCANANTLDLRSSVVTPTTAQFLPLGHFRQDT